MADEKNPMAGDHNPTEIGETGAEEIVGDKDKGVVGVDPTIPKAKPGQQADADGTLSASKENDRNEGRGDIAVHHDADGSLTASRDTEKPSTDVEAPRDADGTVTSNRQTNGESRDAAFERDATDKSLAGEK